MNKTIMVNGFSVLLFRICLSAIFITAGISHLIDPLKVAERINGAAFHQFATSFGDPYRMGLLSGYALLIGGIALMLGIFSRWAAVALFLVLLPVTITIQLGNGPLHGPLWKNVALFGGSLFFIINNPKAYTIYHK